MSADLWRVVVRVAEPESEIARARLLDVAVTGFEEVGAGSDVDLVVYADAGLADAVVAAFPAAVVTPVPAGWEDAWRAFHRPAVAGGVWLGPPWEAPPASGPAVVIDPGRAFGTGAHATTRLCIELMAGLERGSLLDIGCGSGVVALAAARLGFGPLRAIDVDPVAVDVAHGNAAANGISLDLAVADAASANLGAWDVAVANITLEVVEAVLARVQARDVVTTGYPVTAQPAVEGWTSVRRVELDGWAADHFRPRI